MQKFQLTGSALVGVRPLRDVLARLTGEGDVTPEEALPTEVCLGRARPRARTAAPALEYYYNPSKVVVPDMVDYYSKADAAIRKMYLNDKYGCCVISDRFHSIGVWSANDTGIPIIGTDSEVLAAYRIWNPGNRDNGCVITDVLDYNRDRGLKMGGQLRKIDGYVAVNWTNKLETQVALYLFGANPIGVNLPQDWLNNAIWDLTNSPIVGGHDIPVVGFNQDGVQVSSWGRIYTITWRAFVSRKFIEEQYAVLSPDWYNSDKLAPNFIDAATLRSDLTKIGNGTIPPIDPSMQSWENILPEYH